MSSNNKYRIRITHIVILYLLWFKLIESQVAVTELSKVGIIKGRNYGLKIKGVPTQQYMVIKMIPNLSNVSNCHISVTDEYKDMVKRILTPINNALTKMRSAIQDRIANVRFWGAVVGGVALGVATSAQITAGIALHNSNQNAKAILNMKDSIEKSNAAISKLQSSVAGTVIAISALQEQINTQIIPLMNQLSCDILNNKLGLSLNQYFSEISLVFGPSLQYPATSTLSIQAISQAFNGDFQSLLETLGYKDDDFLDVLESNSILARIIDVSLEGLFLVLQIEYPSLVNVPDAIVQEFNLISYNYDGQEWMSIFPPQILIRGSFLSNIDINKCVTTKNNMICPHDTSSPISEQLYSCLLGNTSNCARTPVVNSHVSRYALSEGVLFANCVPMACHCKTTEQAIIQDAKTTTIMIHKDYCEEVFIDGVYITLGQKVLNRTEYSTNISVGYPTTLDPVDISNELSNVKKELEDSKELIEQANNILKNVNPAIVTTGSIVFTIVITTILSIWFVVSLGWLIMLTRIVRSNQYYTGRKSPTVNSLSSLITNEQRS
ncbi:fusion protein [Parajeilongvirus diaemi]|nr:fusion protein [Diaemus bat paramyxovirus]